MDWHSFWYGYSSAAIIMFSTQLLYAHFKYKYTHCKYCNQKYEIKKSTSEYQWILCSPQCEFFEMLDYLSKHMSLEDARKQLLTNPKYREMAIYSADGNNN